MITTIVTLIAGFIIPCSGHCRPKTLMTFNAALTPLSPQYETRRTQIAQAINNVDADVVCLQEVKFEEDIIEVMRKLQWKYRYSFSFLHSTVITAYEVFTALYLPRKLKMPCAGPSIANFTSCVVDKCRTADEGQAFSICILEKCVEELFMVPDDCLSCLGVSSNSLKSVISTCFIPKKLSRLQAHDILVLSKMPIISAKKIRFIPGIKQIFPTGLLEVEILGIGKVVCTHLTADLSPVGIPYIEFKLTESLGLTNYVDQQALEIAQIIELYGSTNVIVAGDLNIGPAVPSENITATVVQHYNELTGTGFKSPYVDLVKKCTFCADNPMAVPLNQLIDHVLLRGFVAVQAMRILDHAQVLSDHYGVSVSFCPAYDWWG